MQPKVNTGLKKSQSDYAYGSSSKKYNSIGKPDDSLNEMMFNQVTIIHNYRLDEEIDINLGKEVQGEIRTCVESKYADLEKILSSNLGDKLKEVCEI